MSCSFRHRISLNSQSPLRPTLKHHKKEDRGWLPSPKLKVMMEYVGNWRYGVATSGTINGSFHCPFTNTLSSDVKRFYFAF
jgi:hypothetical protein